MICMSISCAPLWTSQPCCAHCNATVVASSVKLRFRQVLDTIRHLHHFHAPVPVWVHKWLIVVCDGITRKRWEKMRKNEQTNTKYGIFRFAVERQAFAFWRRTILRNDQKRYTPGGPQKHQYCHPPDKKETRKGYDTCIMSVGIQMNKTETGWKGR